ncbi:unnamed protein product [Somion occarium]|uniref:Peptide hydrolase n=1 Tax=Somion occarium TaxID=3059160 RepID=A0ABP1DXG6_9APHY
MAFGEWLTRPLKFHPLQVSVVTFVVYGLVFLLVLVHDQTPDISTDLTGLNLAQAYEDLHELTARPHPYASHANDETRSFILSRLHNITAGREFVHLADDLVSNASYVSGTSQGTYFEGSNILVKIDGKRPSQTDGVVFSVHFDSVPTAPGATDNSMSVATLLQLVEHFSHPEGRPRRNAFFLFNNGEEDGLNGAHVFFEHPWSNFTSTFVNLEGAGAGGRPLLFQSTSLWPVYAYASDSVAHPLGNSLTVDAFSRGLVRSRTDFQVFKEGIKGEKNGLSGVDIAFYKNRALYHTPFDSIPAMGKGESRRSLWIMMNTIKGLGTSLLNDDQPDDGGDSGVYFDCSSFVVFSRSALFATNIVLLILGPISVVILLAWVIVLSKIHRSSDAPEEDLSTAWAKVKKVLITALGWGRFWIALVLCIAAHVGLVVGYVKLNPFVVHAHPYWVLVTSMSLTFLSFAFPLSLFHFFLPSPPTSQKLAIVLEIFFFTWILLVFATIGVHLLGLGGFYWITAWYLCAWIASLLGLAEGAERARKGGEAGGKGELDLVGERPPTPVEEHPDGVRHVRGVLYQVPEEPDEEQGDGHHEPVETEPTDITPLMSQHRRYERGREYIVGVDNELTPVASTKAKNVGFDETGWWILQFIALVPFSAILIFQILILVLHALSETLVDGSSPIVVYSAVSALSVLILIGLAPFAHKIHHLFTFVVALVFIVSLVYLWTTFPFTQEAPLKLFFQQKLELDIPSLRSSLYQSLSPQSEDVSTIVRAVTTLTGPRRYLDKSVIPELRSSWGKHVDCNTDTVLRPGLLACSWESNLLPSPGGNTSTSTAPTSILSSRGATKPSDWLSASFVRTGPSTAIATVRGTNTRSCRLKFDKPISHFHVRNGGRLQPGYELPDEGIQDLIMWSRTWNSEFVVDFEWAGADDESTPFSGSVACEWVEYATASAGSSYATTSGQIPALEEALHFLPFWATITKWTYGLLEAEARFSF